MPIVLSNLISSGFEYAFSALKPHCTGFTEPVMHQDEQYRAGLEEAKCMPVLLGNLVRL